MGWLHSAPPSQQEPVAYASYASSGYPSTSATGDNVVPMTSFGCSADNSTAYRMTLPMPLPQSPSTSSSSSPSPHDYNHPRNSYSFMGATVVANMPQQQSSPFCMAHNHNEYPPLHNNSNRMMRNLAEKMRRDKLNTYINELSTLVPMVSNSPKKMDKTSVLRLATTFLRMHRVTEATRDPRRVVPPILDSCEWPQSLLNKMDGVMLIVTSAGKIVFISHNIEKVLGHTQTELMGHGLSNITYPPDLAELKRCLTPDKEDESCSDNVGNNTNDSTLVERQRRSFFLRLRHRCLARSEQPQYEPMQVNGFLRVPKKYTSQAQKKSRKSKGEMVATNSNEILLVAVMKPACEMTSMSIVEASQEEYVTRHWYDGRIVFCDQRISLVSGYMPWEVKGLQAFQFMAKEEVHWVMIALRQMLWNREGFGKSCYRLKRKNGDFIYMVTHGYLEPCEDLQKSTFVCVNTLVSMEEGEREIRIMKKKFTPIIERKDEPVIAAIAQKYTFSSDEDHNTQDYTLTTEDPVELKTALKAMVTNIPAPVEVKEDPEKCRDLQFAKVKYISKTFPPASIPTCKLITVVEDKTSPLQPTSSSSSTTTTTTTTASLSPSPALSPSQSASSISNTSASTGAAATVVGTLSPQQHAAAVSPSSAIASSATSFQNRPSVLRIAPARQTAVQTAPAAAASNDPYSITSTSNADGDGAAVGDAVKNGASGRKHSAASYSSPVGYASTPSPTSCDFIEQECRIKREIADANEYDGDENDAQLLQINERNDNNRRENDDNDDDNDLEAQLAAVIQADAHQQLAAAVASALENERVGVAASGRSAVKRHLNCDGTSFASSVVPVKKNTLFVDSATNHRQKYSPATATAAASRSPHRISSSTPCSLSPSYVSRRSSVPYCAATIAGATVMPALDSGNLQPETTDVSQMDDSYTRLSGIEIGDPTSRFVRNIADTFETEGEPEQVLRLLDDNVNHRHIELETNMQIQGAQIRAIEGDLNEGPVTNEQIGLQTDLTLIKEQYVRQKQTLMTLQQGNHNLQHYDATDTRNISGTVHQNVGV